MRGGGHTNDAMAHLRARMTKGLLTPQEYRAACATIVNKHPSAPESLDHFFDSLLGIDSNRGVGEQAINPTSYPYLPSCLKSVKVAIDKYGTEPTDSLADLGCGIGRVPMFVHLYTGIKTRGVELLSSLAGEGQRIVATHGLSSVSIENASAFRHDLNGASIIFMYEPCKPDGMRIILQRLEQLALDRPFRLWWMGHDHTMVSEATFLDWQGNPPHGQDRRIFQALTSTSNIRRQ